MKQDAYSTGSTGDIASLSVRDLVHFCSSWTWRAVEALIQSPDFKSSPQWIADRLNISVEAAKDALDGLQRLGIVKINDDKISGTAELLKYETGLLERSDAYHIHTKIRDQITARMSSRDCFANTILLSNRENIEDFYEKFAALVGDLHEKSLNQGTSQEVFAIELSFARLTREQK